MAKILGMECEKVKKGKYSVSQKDINEFLEKKGITKEIRKEQKAAEEELIQAGVEFAGAEVCKIKEPVTVSFGGGDGKMDVTVHDKRTFRNPQEPNTPIIKFGGVSVRVRKKVPSKFHKESWMQDINADIEKAIG